MKKIIFAIVLMLNCFNIQAQNISDATALKQFYYDYFSYSNIENINKFESLVKLNCTQEFYKAWYHDITEIGLYDPLTNGFCEDPDMMKRTLTVKEEGNGCYLVSFKYLTWPDNKIIKESVYVYVNKDGKISHTKRPSDGYMTPQK